MWFPLLIAQLLHSERPERKGEPDSKMPVCSFCLQAAHSHHCDWGPWVPWRKRAGVWLGQPHCSQQMLHDLPLRKAGVWQDQLWGPSQSSQVGNTEIPWPYGPTAITFLEVLLCTTESFILGWCIMASGTQFEKSLLFLVHKHTRVHTSLNFIHSLGVPHLMKPIIITSTPSSSFIPLFIVCKLFSRL